MLLLTVHARDFADVNGESFVIASQDDELYRL